jgi:hypothetical protein
MAQQQTFSRYKKISAALVATVIVVGGGVLSSGTTSAKKASNAVPQAPTIVSIESKVAKNKKTANVVVTVALPSNVSKKSIALTEVNAKIYGVAKRCVIPKAKTSCVFKNLDSYSDIQVTARTKANNKFSKSSKRLSFSVNRISRKWFNPQANRVPVPVTNRNLAGVLKSSGEKVTNLQGIQRRARASSMSMVRAGSVTASSNVRFTLNVSTSVALAQPEGGSNSGSGLIAISSTGEVSDAITVHELSDPSAAPGSTYTIKVSKFFTGPDGQIYLQMTGPIQLTSAPVSCLFFRVNQDTGIPQCVDSNLTGMHWYGGFMMQRFTNPGVQFDAAGNVYYMGYNFSIGGGGAVLRKYDVATGQITDLITSNTRLEDFAVLPNGSVIIVGNTNSTGQQWTRVIAGANVVRPLAGPLDGIAARFVARFADGNYYLGRQGSMGPGSKVANGVVRYNVATGQLDSKYWLSAPMWGTEGLVLTPAYNDVNGLCLDARGNMTSSSFFCQNGGAGVAQVATTGTRSFIVNQSAPGSDALLMEYFPSVKEVPISIKRVSLIVAAGSKLVVAGANEAGTNVMSIYDPETGTETIVSDATNETEIYSMSYVPAINKVMFSGLQFSTNTNVVGEINIS